MIIQHGLMAGQVLQRLKKGGNATVTGECKTSGDVSVTISSGSKALKGWNAKKAGRATGGKFTARLDGIPVGGPYTVKLLVGKESVSVAKVYVGDVWLLAGQSNMQGCGNMDRAPKPHPKVHALYMDGHWDVAVEPIHFLQESPDPVHNITVFDKAALAKERRNSKKGVGPGIFFGAEMVKRSGGVPQGLLCTAHGGTSMQQWSPDKKDEGGKSLYGSMYKSWSLTGQPVSGILWYQGESDTNEADAALYTKRMKELVAAFRKDLKQPNLPFILVQIGKFFSVAANGKWWNSVQDQEANLHKHIKNCACVSAADLSLDDLIHVSSEGYARLGVRLARLADHLAYANKKEPPAPECVSITKSIADGVGIIDLKFKNVVGGFRSAGYPNGFALVDQDYRDTTTIFKTELLGDRIRLHGDLWQVSNSNLMYGHGLSPVVNITDARDMPIPVLGPKSLGKAQAFTPFVTLWHVSKILPATQPIDAWEAPLSSAAPEFAVSMKKFEGIFCDMHLEWTGKPGQAVFFSRMDLVEDMELIMRFGYDGPIRVWVDEKAVYTDMAGTNPAIADAKSVPLSLKQGAHKLTVAMDLNQGRAWGFFMRFERTGVSAKELAETDVALPKFSV